MCTKPPFLSREINLTTARHKQSALITHYTALHSTPFTCRVWGVCFLLYERLQMRVCVWLLVIFAWAQWVVLCVLLDWIVGFQLLSWMSSMVRCCLDVTYSLWPCTERHVGSVGFYPHNQMLSHQMQTGRHVAALFISTLSKDVMIATNPVSGRGPFLEKSVIVEESCELVALCVSRLQAGIVETPLGRHNMAARTWCVKQACHSWIIHGRMPRLESGRGKKMGIWGGRNRGKTETERGEDLASWQLNRADPQEAQRSGASVVLRCYCFVSIATF